MIQNNFHSAPAVRPVVFEQVFAEKAGGGGAVDFANYDSDLCPAATPVGRNTVTNLWTPIKQVRLTRAVAAADTTIEVAKNSGFKDDDYIAFGKKSVQITAVDNTNPTHDVLTVTMGVALPVGAKGYQAAAASASAAAPIYSPRFVLGVYVDLPTVNEFCKLINGANVIESSAVIAPEIAAMLKLIDLV